MFAKIVRDAWQMQKLQKVLVNRLSENNTIFLNESVLSIEKEIKSEKHTLMQRLKFI